MRHWRASLCWSIAVLAAAAPAMADGPSLGVWNPFGRRTTKTESCQMLDGEPINRSVSKRSLHEPTFFDHVASGTKKVVTTTTDILTFRWARGESPKQASYTVSQYPRNAGDFPLAPTRQQKQEKKSGFSFGNLFGGGADEPQQFETPQDWMGGERPG